MDSSRKRSERQYALRVRGAAIKSSQYESSPAHAIPGDMVLNIVCSGQQSLLLIWCRPSSVVQLQLAAGTGSG